MESDHATTTGRGAMAPAASPSLRSANILQFNRRGLNTVTFAKTDHESLGSHVQKGFDGASGADTGTQTIC